MQIINCEFFKGGKFMIKEILEVVLAIAATILIVMVMYSIISPVFDRGEETAESYFRLLEESLAEVDRGNHADFSMWQPDDDKYDEDGNKLREYYVIYFGNRTFFEYDGHKFFAFGINKNYICVCYVENGETECGDCKSLDLPARKIFPGGGMIKFGEDPRDVIFSGRWAIGVGKRVRVSKESGYYDFALSSDPLVFYPEDDKEENVYASEEEPFEG